jgi:NADH pyrophosphatase NudC (nudix superfamily)
MNFVDNELGHWERQERYCYKCGNKMQKDENNGSYYCSSCNVIEGSQIDNVIPHGSDIPF